ncbi:MAG: hypothetical protein IV108_10760 [Burkholderiales bacterium]|nr:hypothetical protein [Burkholderiales bacterium]
MGGFFYVPTAFAGIFGPSNFEECVLDKMKGQAPNLIYMAKAACLKAFPPKPSEGVIADDRIKYTWCKSEYDSVAVCIDQTPTNVTITKVEGLFFEDDCGAKQQSKPGITATAAKPWYGTTYKFELPAAKRGCAIFTFYGIEK